MTSPTASAARLRTSSPAWPLVMLATMLGLAILSIAQGIVDVVLPAFRDEPAFTWLGSMTREYGAAFLVGYVFLHNVGLACVVPGFGFLAARFERKPGNRALIGLLLATSVVVSLLVALEYLFQAAERFDLALALAIFTIEASAVLAVALASARELKGFVPTRRVEWSLVTPFRRLAIPLAYAVCALLLVAGIEAWHVLA